MTANIIINIPMTISIHGSISSIEFHEGIMPKAACGKPYTGSIWPFIAIPIRLASVSTPNAMAVPAAARASLGDSVAPALDLLMSRNTARKLQTMSEIIINSKIAIIVRNVNELDAYQGAFEYVIGPSDMSIVLP
ncbi:hypothetical protein D3C77_652740 [compost metagenome]